MINDKDAILVMDQIDRIQHKHFPNMDGGNVSIAEAYRLAELEGIRQELVRIGNAVSRLSYDD